MAAFQTVAELITLSEKRSIPLSQLVWEDAALESDSQTVYDKMLSQWEVMQASAHDGINPDLRSMGGLMGGNAYKMAHSQTCIANAFTSDLLTYALSCAELNACMGRIVAAPTAGSCGILPACLLAMRKHHNFDNHKIVMGLFNASGIGMVIAKRAYIAGAQGGCQAECGSASAMAASAMVELMGGTPSQCGHAAAHALKSVLGLVCDPVAGLVEEPCVIRNASGALNALAAAELALAGVDSVIPVDEVILAMKQIGDSLPASLRETAGGGLAVTATGKAIAKRLKGGAG